MPHIGRHPLPNLPPSRMGEGARIGVLKLAARWGSRSRRACTVTDIDLPFPSEG